MILTSERLEMHPTTVKDLVRLREIIQTPGTAEWWGFYEGSHDDDALLAGWTLRLDGTVIGWLGAAEVTSAKYRSVGLDIMIEPDHHGKGYGPEALRCVIDHFVERGHHRFTVDPSVTNERAIKAYERTGFRPVGTLREYEQLQPGQWGDGLLMDLIVSDLA